MLLGLVIAEYAKRPLKDVAGKYHVRDEGEGAEPRYVVDLWDFDGDPPSSDVIASGLARPDPKPDQTQGEE